VLAQKQSNLRSIRH